MAKPAAKESKDEEKDDVEVEEGGEKSKKKKPWLMIGVIAVSSILALSAGIGATIYFVGGKHKAPEASAKAKGGKAAKAEADAEAEDKGDSADAAEGDGEEKSNKPAPANYVSLDPPFVVNFEGNSSARFLQINVEVMSRKAEYAEHIKKHMPVIRNNLVMLFGSQTYDKVNTLKGKEDLRQKALTEVQKILEEETGDPGIEALYFTSFVMQ
ncbi:MAG: flagellar basal body-associated FliL family protein [Gammaproteobacteria bacterium]|nr:flagellar basal body-associated FliL family protein [Gammaproteobacteria bacterium]